VGLIADKLVSVRATSTHATTELVTSCSGMLDDKRMQSPHAAHQDDDAPFPERDDLHQTSVELAEWLQVAGALASRLVGRELDFEEMQLTVDKKTEEYQVCGRGRVCPPVGVCVGMCERLRWDL